jgi:proteasome lid subunit RPN8/RPN11
MVHEISMEKFLLEDFVQEVKRKYPKKAFGYFLSDASGNKPDAFYIFEEDVRNDLKNQFEQYGNYYKIHEDAGFLAPDEELVTFHRKIAEEGKRIIGVFHSHQRHPAIFSKVDVDMHPSGELWHLIISLKNFELPQIKIFKIESNQVKEIALNIQE